MALSKLFKKKVTVPNELPDLAIDELKKSLKETPKENKETSETEKPAEETPAEEKTEEQSAEEQPAETSEDGTATEESSENAEEKPAEENSEATNEEQPAEEKTESEENSESTETTEEQPSEETPAEENNELDPEKSFFNHLLKEMDEDVSDVEKLSKWYNEKFSKENTVQEMKKHWHKQKNEMIIRSLGKEFKDKIDTKMKNLQKLESDWQKIYFNLITKEEEIKKEELEMKKIIRDFLAIFNKKPHQKKQNIKKVKKV